MGRLEITTEEVLKLDIPLETYMSTKLITGTDLQLLRRYDKKSDSQKAALLDDILRVLITILDTSSDSTALAVACHDLSQFIQYHPAGRIIVSDPKAKDRVMKLMNHENPEVTKNALLCVQRLLLGSKYASILEK